MFVLGPAIAIVVLAIVLAVVFVTRNSKQSANTTSIPGVPPNNPVPPNPPAKIGAALNGTSIVSASPDNEDDALWVFYQNYAGNLVYSPLEANGSCGAPVILPTRNCVLNGTALTALDLKGDTPKINLIYQDSTGYLRNFRYNRPRQSWSEGGVDSHRIALPTASNLVKRLAYYVDNGNFQHIYYTGTDGLIHEYTM